jgi:hypothetical protein
MTTSKNNGRLPQQNQNGRQPPEKLEDDLKKNKTYQSTKINLIGCDTIENSPSNLISAPMINIRKSVVYERRKVVKTCLSTKLKNWDCLFL